MTSLSSPWIWLVCSLVAADESVPARQPQPSVRVFADLKHTGILAGPLSSPAPDEFGIAVPIPAVSGGRDRLPEMLDHDDEAVARLGRCALRQRLLLANSSFLSKAIVAAVCAFSAKIWAGGGGRR